MENEGGEEDVKNKWEEEGTEGRGDGNENVKRKRKRRKRKGSGKRSMR